MTSESLPDRNSYMGECLHIILHVEHDFKFLAGVAMAARAAVREEVQADVATHHLRELSEHHVLLSGAISILHDVMPVTDPRYFSDPLRMRLDDVLEMAYERARENSSLAIRDETLTGVKCRLAATYAEAFVEAQEGQTVEHPYGEHRIIIGHAF